MRPSGAAAPGDVGKALPERVRARGRLGAAGVLGAGPGPGVRGACQGLGTGALAVSHVGAQELGELGAVAEASGEGAGMSEPSSSPSAFAAFVGLIGCCGPKTATEGKAREVYTSDLTWPVQHMRIGERKAFFASQVAG